VTERDGTTSNVDLFPGKLENLLGTNGNDGKCLVELPQSDIVFADTGSLEGLGDGKSWSSREIDRSSSSIGVA